MISPKKKKDKGEDPGGSQSLEFFSGRGTVHPGSFQIPQNRLCSLPDPPKERNDSFSSIRVPLDKMRKKGIITIYMWKIFQSK